MSKMIYSAAQEQTLMTEIWDPQVSENLETFVLFNFPWGKSNTPLESFSGPRTWQRDELQAITEHILINRQRIANGKDPLIYQSATASGRGPGKSALVSWLNLWMLSTRIGSTAINTANTESQLLTRTWPEVGKWHTMSINSHWFEKTALSLKPAPWFKEALHKQLQVDTGYYYSQAQLWSEENPDAFAGVHNHKGVLLVFDEASGIPKPIWTVSEGFFTEPVIDRYWFVFSNPRRNTGPFFECFHAHRSFWKRRSIDSRTVEGTDKTVLNAIVQKHGEDSDEARVEVKGEFPRQGDKQFISRGVVDQAVDRQLEIDTWAPLIMGVDPARFGDDSTVIRFRQGRDGRSIPAVKLKGKDNMEVANECARLIDQYQPDAVCIDAGNGTGVIDRLRERKYRVHEVWFGKKAESPEWADTRTELWARMREWLGGGSIDNDPDLIDDLTAPQYTFMGATDRQKLESKEHLKKRGFSSPDNGDALACTFAIRVARKDSKLRKNPTKTPVARDTDYKIFG